VIVGADWHGLATTYCLAKEHGITDVGVSGARAGRPGRCPLDLHPKAFGPGAVTRTLLGKAAVVLRRPGEADAYELWVNGSFAPYVWLFLRNAVLEFGVTLAA